MDCDNNFLPIGTILDNGTYCVVKFLASGGFGNTYVVTHQNFQKQFVMKEFFIKGINERDNDGTTVCVSNPVNKNQFEQHLSKFFKEAQLLCGLHNEHIVKVHNLFKENGTAYYVMDYIDGKSLDRVVVEHGFIPEEEVRIILDEMLDALSAIHSKGIYHLDIKPANIMRDSHGHVHLIDFGASKQQDPLTKGGFSTAMPAFTPAYAPIEQVEGNIGIIGTYTDFYSLGATLFKLVTGNNPPQHSNIIFGGKSVFNFPAHVSEDMQQLIQWMMKPNHSNRPQSVNDIRLKLNGTQVKPNPKSNKWIYAFFACLLLAAVVVFFLFSRPPETKLENNEPQPTQIETTQIKPEPVEDKFDTYEARDFVGGFYKKYTRFDRSNEDEAKAADNLIKANSTQAFFTRWLNAARGEYGEYYDELTGEGDVCYNYRYEGVDISGNTEFSVRLSYHCDGMEEGESGYTSVEVSVVKEKGKYLISSTKLD